MTGWFDKEASAAKAAQSIAQSMSDQEILNLQISSITRDLNHIFKSQAEYGEGNLIPILSGGRARSEYVGFVPYVMPHDMDDFVANAKHSKAMSGLRFIDGGTGLVSSTAGRVLAVGQGNEFSIELPDCPQELCLDRQYTFN